MRLIDAYKLFDSMREIKGHFIMGVGEVVNTIDVFEQIKNAPTIDAVEIVRCKDCKYLGIKDLVYRYCKYRMTGIIMPNDYCSYGERKEL